MRSLSSLVVFLTVLFVLIFNIVNAQSSTSTSTSTSTTSSNSGGGEGIPTLEDFGLEENQSIPAGSQQANDLLAAVPPAIVEDNQEGKIIHLANGDVYIDAPICETCTDKDNDSSSSSSSSTSTSGGGPTPTPPTCLGNNYFDAPAADSVLLPGQSYSLNGWARFCVGPAGQGTRDRVNLYRCINNGGAYTN